jgi:hypothetical protein
VAGPVAGWLGARRIAAELDEVELHVLRRLRQ